ncbi:uncharacterized protein, partial [Parasteatoda tepidariorum]|uniref:uncharacterized protein n=1 Tax=Parasteatoda tepidariorum TaxID=114398 RepID=UPI001C727747
MDISMIDEEADEAIRAVPEEVLQNLDDGSGRARKKRSNSRECSPMRGYGRKKVRKISTDDEMDDPTEVIEDAMDDPAADELIRNFLDDPSRMEYNTTDPGPSTSNVTQRLTAEHPHERQAIDGGFRSHTLFTSKNNDLLLFLEDLKCELFSTLRKYIALSPIKWYLCVKALFSRTGQGGERELATSFFRSCNEISLNSDTLEEQVNCAYSKIISSFDEFIDRGSGWVLEEVNYLEINTAHYVPLNGSSFIPLPSEIAKRRAVLNIRNYDEKCFLWSVLANLHPCPDRKQATRVTKYLEFENELNVAGISFPMKLTQISKFEKLNNLSINVFGHEKGDIFPLHLSTNRTGVNHSNLLLISEGETRHFCLIKNMSRLLTYLTSHKGTAFYCDYCLHRFSSQKMLDDHVNYCKNHKMQKIDMPTAGENILKFKSTHMMHKIPYVIYADFECILVDDSTNIGSHTEVNARHVPCGYSYVIIDSAGKCLKPPVVYNGENAAERFIHSLLGEEKMILDLLSCVGHN